MTEQVYSTFTFIAYLSTLQLAKMLVCSRTIASIAVIIVFLISPVVGSFYETYRIVASTNTSRLVTPHVTN